MNIKYAAIQFSTYYMTIIENCTPYFPMANDIGV